jgi:hypothetical protein
LYTTLLYPASATCPAHYILPDLFTQIRFSEEYRTLSSSLCSLLHLCYLVSLRPKYCQRPTLRHYQTISYWQLSQYNTQRDGNTPY